MTAQSIIQSHQPEYQTIQLGQAILSLPNGIDMKPYVRQLLRVELEAIQNPIARAAIERGLNEATTDEDFSSLLETFHLLSSPANADRLITTLERSTANETRSQSVEEFRQEMGPGEETL
ncbi:hypothetical protein LEP3755_46330 [Leptolyngbya sp. NIES-3755]|nr:hypothetical protein LEP3755_46330 [Leptolyngbya sp. NIES-3755]